MRMMAFERVVGALEIAGCGVATSVGGFVLGLSQTSVLIAVYAVTVISAYALIACLQRVQPLPQPGND